MSPPDGKARRDRAGRRPVALAGCYAPAASSSGRVLDALLIPNLHPQAAVSSRNA